MRRTNGYYAGAKVERVTPAPSTPGMFLALIEPGGYLNFATPMPFADKSGPLEQGILNQAGHISRRPQAAVRRSEEHTSELQSLMRISYAVFCLKKKKPYISYTLPFT